MPLERGVASRMTRTRNRAQAWLADRTVSSRFFQHQSERGGVIALRMWAARGLQSVPLSCRHSLLFHGRDLAQCEVVKSAASRMSCRAALSAMSGALASAAGRKNAMAGTPAIIDALDRAHPEATIGTRWELIADRVMGGVSSGGMNREMVAGRPALRMQGDVSLENNGGFVQIALDLAPGGGSIDASAWAGVEIDVLGNGEHYNLHLRTDDVVRPWQSYHAGFAATPEWRAVRLAFADFEPHRLDAPLDLTRLRRLGVVAIGRAFAADIAIAGMRFYL